SESTACAAAVFPAQQPLHRRGNGFVDGAGQPAQTQRCPRAASDVAALPGGGQSSFTVRRCAGRQEKRQMAAAIEREGVAISDHAQSRRGEQRLEVVLTL